MVLSPRICYVCGGPGASLTLHSRSVKNGAYFPFLESHEAPKGVRPPSKDGAVDSCNICYAFLNQQWDSYEKNHTPLVKRLYWLKRFDNRPFTGAEMRMQGEYAAQVMGLQYYPSNTGTMSPYEYSPISSQTKSGAKANSTERCSPAPSADITQGADEYEEDENGALDLSLTSSTSRDDSVLTEQRSKISVETFQCHTCKSIHSVSSKRIIFSRCIKTGEPYFSFLLQTLTGKSSKRVEFEVCKLCKDSLFEQWSIFEYKKLPEHMRNYCIQNSPVFKTFAKQGEAAVASASDSFSSTSGTNEEDVCYICGQFYSRTSMKMLNTKPPQDKSSKHSMFFPFIAELKRHPGARPIDKHGRVVSCRACYSYLQRQWQGYQQENISSRDRKYVLRPLTETEAETSIETSMDRDSSLKREDVDTSIHTTAIGHSLKEEQETEDESKAITPLNIEINTSSSKGSTKCTQSSFPGISSTAEGLLAIAPHISPQMMMSAMYNPGQIFYGGIQGMYLPPTSKSDASQTGGHAAVKQEVVEETTSDTQKKAAKSSARREHDQDMKTPSSLSSHLHGDTGHHPQFMSSSSRRSESRASSVFSEASDATSVLSDGLSGAKPPPLNMVSSMPRTTVTVPPLNPVSPGSSITSTASSLSAHGTRQNHSSATGNSFAAALRKLAKQAEGPETSPVDHTCGSDSSATSPRDSGAEVTSKRSTSSQPTMNYGSHHHHPPPHPLGGAPSGSGQAPPVVTIAPTPSLTSYVGSDRKNSDRRTPTNAMLDPLGIKPERDKMTPSHDRREDDRPHSKDSAHLAARITPHPAMPSVSSANSLHEEITRGFQPYRTGEEALRHSALAAAGAIPTMDPAAYPAAYAQAAAAAALAAGYPPTSPYAAHLRMDDPLLLERYRMMQSTLGGYSYHPSFLAPMSQYLGAGGRHPAELLSQMGYPYLPPGTKLPDHLSPGAAERLQSEEEAARRERDAQREREKELERREKEERERVEKEIREREERLEKEREKERLMKDAELRQNAGSGSSYSTDRHLGGSSGVMYPMGPNPHEPLNLKRTSEDDHSRAALHRQLNGDRGDTERHMSNYSLASTRSGLPTLGVPPMSIPKPQNLSSHSKDIGRSSVAETHAPTFHRPFEISSGGNSKTRAHSSSSNSGGGAGSGSGGSTSSSSTHGLLAPANGYDRDSYLEYERKLLAEREKMLAEHRLSQEKAQQLRTGSSGSGGSGSHGNQSGGAGSHGDSSVGDNNNSTSSRNNSKERGRDYSVSSSGDTTTSSNRIMSDREMRDLGKSSSLHTTSASSSSSSHLESKHSMYRSPHKSLLPSNSSASSKSHTHHHQQQQHLYSYGKESIGGSNTSKEHQSSLPKQAHLHHNIHHNEAVSKSSHYTSALTSLQNYSNSKVSSGFSSTIHSDTVAEESRKNGGVGSGAPRINGSYPGVGGGHVRGGGGGPHGGDLLVSPSGERKKEGSGQHQYPQVHHSHRSTGGHNRPNNVRSPKKIRQLLGGGSTLSKDKLEEGEPPLKKAHLSSGDADPSVHRTDLSALESGHPEDEHHYKREPDYRKKTRFLFSLQLEPVSPDRRKELEFKQKVCEWDQIRRCKMLENPPAPCSVDTVSLPYEYMASKLTQLVTTCIAEERTKQMSSSLELAGLATTTLSTAVVSSRSSGPLAPNSTPPPLPSSSLAPANSTGPPAPPLSRSVIYSATAGTATSGPESGKPALSQDFAYEFHESVLQETRQQRAQKGNQPEKSHQDVRYTLISDSTPPSSHFSRKTSQQQQPADTNSTQHLPPSLQSIQNMTSQLLTEHSSPATTTTTQHTVTSQHKGVTSPHSGSQHSLTDSWGEELRWPGVDNIMMAYQKHLEEVNTEKQILQEQSHKLLTHHRELSKMAEDLSARMTDLLQNKRQAEDERTKYQTELDNMRKQLLALR